MLRLFKFTKEYSTALKILNIVEGLIHQNYAYSKEVIQADIQKKIILKALLGDVLERYMGGDLYLRYQSQCEEFKHEIRCQLARSFYLSLKVATNDLSILDVKYADIYEGCLYKATFVFPADFFDKGCLERNLHNCLSQVRERLSTLGSEAYNAVEFGYVA